MSNQRPSTKGGPQPPPPGPSKMNPGNPKYWQQPATTLFRITNFELFAKPNKVVMAIGLVTMTSCVAYIAYLNATTENKKYYEAYDDEGNSAIQKRSSKWE